MRESLRALRIRGCRTNPVVPQGGLGVTKRAGSRTSQESLTVEGYSPVGESRATPTLAPE
jgi:hypothetical protein